MIKPQPLPLPSEADLSSLRKNKARLTHSTGIYQAGLRAVLARILQQELEYWCFPDEYRGMVE